MDNLTEQKAKLLGSFILFTQVFYKLRTGREFVISKPTARESHHLIIAKELTQILRADFNQDDINLTLRKLITVPPRYGKTELIIHFIAWALAHYPDSNFICVSYSHSLAKKLTQTVREIITLPMYRHLFGVELKGDANAKDNFETTANGSVYAAGAGGTITGRGAGIQNSDRFSGAIIIDDIHKPSEVTSDTMRQSIIDWYLNTLQSRVNNPYVPVIFIGQRLHADDLASYLIKGFDSYKWRLISIQALDAAKNALMPTMHTKEQLLSMQEKMPYEFAAQYQQDPQPAGGGIFKPEWFELKEQEPELLATFITADTAETDKTYNDPSVFSFFGIYKINHFGVETDLYGLHWIDCYEGWFEPKDLESEFMQFLAECMRHPVKPSAIAIEKKSTGVTLLSTVKKIQGLRVIEVERTKASGSKTARFLEMQPVVASGLVSLPIYGKHTQACLEHMRKITANDTHRHDDRADTLYDGVKIALIDKLITYITADRNESKDVVKSLAHTFNKRQQVRAKASWHNR